MKYKEALDTINRQFEEAGIAFLGCVRLNVTEFWAVRKALEKQIPKKPYISIDNEPEIKAYHCQACNGYIHSTNTKKRILLEEAAYCGICGQAIDWEGVNDEM